VTRYPITPAEELAVGPEEVPALLVRPRAAGPHPAAIIQHGYGADKGDLLPLGEYLAERGFVVLLPDGWGHGERFSPAGPNFMNAVNMDFIAETVVRTAADARACLDMLAAHPEVQPEAISMAGFSMGGGVALAAGMQDARVAAVVSIAGASVRDLPLLQLPGMQSASEELRRKAEAYDLEGALAAFAPRPLLLMHGRQDDMVNPVAAEHLYEAALPHYQDHPERLLLKWYNVSHVITIPMIVDAVEWLAPFFGR
jgi:dienelactone hydrolase